MPDTVLPYIEKHPRDLITAEDWNDMQVQIKNDIVERLQKAIGAIQQVPKAGDSAKLAGMTPEELAQSIINSAVQELNKRTGYMRVFKKLAVTTEADEPRIALVKHGLKDFPVADVYQLEQFEVVCSEDDNREIEQVLFYLYHTSEKRIRSKDDGGTMRSVEIEGPAERVFKVPFAKMLELYKVEYNEDSSLDDLETEFWDAFLASPNDPFDDDDYCHSPWFDRCCGEKRTVGDLKKSGAWDEIWFQCRPTKTVNADQPSATAGDLRPPNHVKVEQYDFDTLGVVYRPTFPQGEEPPPLPVMLLLKV